MKKIGMVFILALVSGCSKNNYFSDCDDSDNVIKMDRIYDDTVKVPINESLIHKKYLRIHFLKRN